MPSIPSRIVLGSDSIPLIQEAARLFKDTAPVEDVEIQGFVTRLARGPQERSGEVTLDCLARPAVPPSNWEKASTAGRAIHLRSARAESCNRCV